MNPTVKSLMSFVLMFSNLRRRYLLVLLEEASELKFLFDRFFPIAIAIAVVVAAAAVATAVVAVVAVQRV